MLDLDNVFIAFDLNSDGAIVGLKILSARRVLPPDAPQAGTADRACVAELSPAVGDPPARGDEAARRLRTSTMNQLSSCGRGLWRTEPRLRGPSGGARSPRRNTHGGCWVSWRRPADAIRTIHASNLLVGLLAPHRARVRYLRCRPESVRPVVHSCLAPEEFRRTAATKRPDFRCPISQLLGGDALARRNGSARRRRRPRKTAAAKRCSFGRCRTTS